MDPQDLRQGFRPAGRKRADARSRRMEEGKAKFSALLQHAVLQRAAADHHGGLLRRSDVRRQPRQGGMEDGRLSRVCRRSIATRSRPTSTRNTTRRRSRSRTFREGRRTWPRSQGSRCGHGRHRLDRQHPGARTDQGRPEGGRARTRRRTARRASDFALPHIRDDLKYSVRQELFQDTQHWRRVTLRHSPSETALPMRRLGSFLPGTGVGGAGAHWNGVHWRLLPTDHTLRSHLVKPLRREGHPRGHDDPGLGR